MKKATLIFTSLLFSLTVFSQSNQHADKTPLQRIILDVGATPFQLNISDVGTLKSLNFGLGYEVGKRLDLRFNLDLNAFINQNQYGPYGPYAENEFSLKKGISLGFNYSLWNDFNFIYDDCSLELLGKFGADINENATQESILYDISLRLKMLDLPYVGIGYNHHIMDFNDMKGIYFTFGLEF
ncbi:hypothetical protein DNU06_09505 [Putridiphycobacter roseus]|uniref:Outer membrane protein beta-barrel domain-containing protein n=1 Tax=Putridiphycobacter roseus TaxID=2219161 RepID=A0A2W1MYN3_9FLAO|nr:hypothetical protein [Putridiphycobacter roseus]PZE16977.1 hypothetical protein DNU06_09505 [Putridiphycobacter roseus]